MSYSGGSQSVPSRRAQRCTEAEDGILLDKECKPGAYLDDAPLLAHLGALWTACPIASLLSRVSLSLCAAPGSSMASSLGHALWWVCRCRPTWTSSLSGPGLKGHRHRVVKVAPLVARHGMLQSTPSICAYFAHCMQTGWGWSNSSEWCSRIFTVRRVSRSLSLPSRPSGSL